MSEILIGSNPDNPQIVGAVNFEASSEEKAKALPEPSGYRLLVAIPEIEKEMELGDSGISLIKADQTLHYEEVLSTVFFVVKMGQIATKTRADSQMAPGAKLVTLF